MSLLALVAGVLAGAGIPCAVIGATALARHGISRSTLDQDLLVMGLAALEPALWAGLEAGGVEVDLRRGDLSDPLGGVVRLRAAGERAVDVVVGKFTWQRRMIERATPVPIPGGDLPVVGRADLILLKLYAGGPQDAWDVHQLLAVATAERDALVAEVESTFDALPRAARRLWQRILAEDPR